MIRLLSFGLLASVAFVAPAAADIRTDCKKDVETFCKSVKPGGGKLMDCVAENRAKVSNECKIAIGDKMLERRAKKAEKKSGKDEDE